MFQLTWKNKKLFKNLVKFIIKKKIFLEMTFPLLRLFTGRSIVLNAQFPHVTNLALFIRRGKIKNVRDFHMGLCPIIKLESIFDYGFDVSFERWAKLESYWSNTPNMINIRHLKLEYKMLLAIDNLASYLSETFSFISSKED